MHYLGSDRDTTKQQLKLIRSLGFNPVDWLVQRRDIVYPVSSASMVQQGTQDE